MILLILNHDMCSDLKMSIINHGYRSIDAEHVLLSSCRGTSQQRNVNVVTVYDIQNKFIGKNYIIYGNNYQR